MRDQPPPPLPTYRLFRQPHHQHLPPWTEAEVLAHLVIGWGEDAISDLKLEYLYGPELRFRGSSTVRGTGSYIVRRTVTLLLEVVPNAQTQHT